MNSVECESDQLCAVVVSGAAGSGKTTFASSFAREVGFALFDLDDVCGPLTASALELAGLGAGKPDGDSLVADLREARYRCLLGTAASNLAVGRDVVVVAPFTRERASVDRWADLVEVLGANQVGGPTVRVKLCHVDCPPSLRLERLVARGATRDAQKIARPESVLGSLGADVPIVGHVRVDGTSTTCAQVRKAVGELGLATVCGRGDPRGDTAC